MDDQNGLEHVWIIFLSTSIFLNSLLTLVFWLLTAKYPIMRPSRHSGIVVHLIYVSSCLLAPNNLLAIVADVVLIRRLLADKSKADDEKKSSKQQKGQKTCLRADLSPKIKRKISVEEDFYQSEEVLDRDAKSREVELWKVSTTAVIGLNGGQ
jgi:hypothetical protein